MDVGMFSMTVWTGCLEIRQSIAAIAKTLASWIAELKVPNDGNALRSMAEEKQNTRNLNTILILQRTAECVVIAC